MNNRLKKLELIINQKTQKEELPIPMLVMKLGEVYSVGSRSDNTYRELNESEIARILSNKGPIPLIIEFADFSTHTST